MVWHGCGHLNLHALAAAQTQQISVCWELQVMMMLHPLLFIYAQVDIRARMH